MGLFSNKSEQTKKPSRSREDLVHFTSLKGDSDTSVKGEFAIDSKALDTTTKFITCLKKTKSKLLGKYRNFCSS